MGDVDFYNFSGLAAGHHFTAEIYVDTDADLGTWEAIDAVRLSGSTVPIPGLSGLSAPDFSASSRASGYVNNSMKE